MKTLLNRLAAWLWDKTSPSEHTIDDLTYALGQADFWRAQWADQKVDINRLQADLAEAQLSLEQSRRSRVTAAKPEKADKTPKERRSRRSGPIKD